MIAATSYDVNLSDTDSSAACQVLKHCFPSNCIIINNAVAHAVPASVRVEPAPQLATHTSSLVFWFRLQLNIQRRGFTKESMQAFKQEVAGTLAVKHGENPGDRVSLTALCSLLHEWGLQNVCFGLHSHIVNGQFFGSEPEKVLWFFRILIHGYNFLNPKPNPTQVATVAVNHGENPGDRNVINSTLIDFISEVISEMPSYPKNLKSYAISVFQPYACMFHNLLLICSRHSDDNGPQRHVLSFDDCKNGIGQWVSSESKYSIKWNGNNWRLLEYGTLIGTQDLSFYKSCCIPSLGCLQSSGSWAVQDSHTSVYSQIQIQISTDCFNQVPSTRTASLRGDVDLKSTSASARRSPSSEVANTTRDLNSTGIPSSSHFNFFDLVGMDAILNAIDLLHGPEVQSHVLGSPLYCSLQNLLERYLVLWSSRDGNSDRWEIFFKAAIKSLKDTGPRDCSPPPITSFVKSMGTYGCYQTHRIFSTTERLMLMVSCSWPAFKWTNIDQKKSNEAMTRIRGMSFSHPRVVQFMRQRMLDEQFINDDDFPSSFAPYSYVNIASNMCHSAISTWNWNEGHCFVFDYEGKYPFLTLTGCGNEFNADGFYGATTYRHDGKIVYAVLTSVVIRTLRSNGVQIPNVADKNCLTLPTIIMVTIDSDVPILHAVQFSFALKSNEPVIKRESDGSYQRFFSIDPSHAMFLYRQMSVPPILNIFGSLPAKFCAKVRFPFGCYIECKVNGVPENLRESLTDQAVHTDGYTGPQQWHANADPSCCASGLGNDNGIVQSSTNDGSSKPVKRGKISPVYFDLAGAHKSSWSSFCAVFPDTFIGVKIGRHWRHVKVSDGCTFLFSFWLKHFGIGKKNFFWHLRLHGYYHSKDIRHFPVSSPESLFVVFAAMKIIDERRCFDQISQEGLESLIMQMLITYTDKTLIGESAPSFHELDQKIIKVQSGEVYEFLYPGTVPAPVPAALADKTPTCDAWPSFQAEAVGREAKVDQNGLPFFGLPNIGLTCGTNAALQCLLHTNDISRMFSDNEFDCSSVPSKDDYEKKFVHLFKKFVNFGLSGDVRSMLNDLVALMRSGIPHDDANAPSLIRPFFDSQPEKPWDAGEVLYYLIDHICPSIFRLTIKSQLTCLECSSRTDLVPQLEYLQLEFPPVGKSQRPAATLADGLKMFLRQEELLPSEKWKCSQCKKLTRSQKQLFLCNLPNYFFITLKRFFGTKSAGIFVNHRIDRIFEVPFEHNFGQSGVYRLYAAICHYAGQPGHFVAYCRPNAMQLWFRCDDDTCKEASDNDVFTDIKRNGYIFFFERKAAMSPTASLDAITQDISRCITLQMGLDLYNQLFDIAMRQGREFTRVSVACGLLQSKSDTWFSKSCRGDFARQCEILAEYCDFKAASPGATAAGATVNEADDIAAGLGFRDAGPHKRKLTDVFAASPLPELPSTHPQPASAARFAHAFPYKFPPHLNFDLSFLPTVSTSIASSLFTEFQRVKAEFGYVQYADDHFDENAKKEHRHLCLVHRPATTIKNLQFVGSETLDWFFVSLATLYPDVLVLSNHLIHWNLQFRRQHLDTKWLSCFLQNVKDRRPKFVLHALNLPKRLDRECHKDTNPEYHYVLTFIVFDWSQTPVSSKIIVLDPFSHETNINAAVQLYTQGKYFSSFNPVFENRQINPIQLGNGNIHCGVYILALALNAVFGTLDSMDARLNPEESGNTCEQGLLLRKFVAWDCTQFPSLLDTFLLACPKFSPISNRSVAVEASAWWVQTPYHNIADSLAIKYGTIFTPVICNRNGNFSEQDRINGNASTSKFNADCPFFFSDRKRTVLVKVICIGLIGHRLVDDRKAAKRAAFAFQECCSTPFVCSKKGWFCETFGLICVGLVCPCAFVCIVRALGTLVQNNGASLVGQSFYDLSRLQFQSSPPKPSATFRVLHGDPHGRNEVLVNSQVQLIDCDKTILITGECPPLFLFTWYAASIAEQPRNPFHIRALMQIIKRSGLDLTHAYFARFYSSNSFLSVTFDADLFEKSPITHWEYDAFLHLFQLLSEEGLEPKLVSDHKIQLKVFIHITWLEQSRPGIITVTCENSHLQAVPLGSHSDTAKFFELFLKHVATTQEQQQQQQQQLHEQAEPTTSFDGLGQLMQLLCQEASRCNDRAPQLHTSDDNNFISCDIRPVCSPDTVVSCKIFFERSATGSIKISSAEFQHHSKQSFLLNNFNAKRDKLFNLKDADEVQKFFNFALSMVPVYGCGSSGSSSGCSDDEDTKKAALSARSPSAASTCFAPVPGHCSPPAASTCFAPVPEHRWLLTEMMSCRNPNVLQSIKDSMIRRFNDVGLFRNLQFVEQKARPSNALRHEYFGCDVVLVNDDSTRDRCIQFVKSQKKFLSLDTETVVPRHNGDGISLIQIGTSTNVFIIQVAFQPKKFFASLGDSLFEKTLVCWGNDETELRRVVTSGKFNFLDVQSEYTPHPPKIGLAECIANLFEGKYILNKAWRLSGWDNNPLTKGQLRYAALDVVCCHALYIASKERVPSLGGRDSVYCRDGKYITFYALNSDSSDKVKHGFSFAPDFLGHYINGSVSKGFRFSESPPLPQGFRAFEGTSPCPAVSVNVREFERLLKECKFCCSLCSSCWVKQSHQRTRVGTTSSAQPEYVDDQNAYECVSMLASFFQLHISEENMQCLKKSVCSDIYYGYICETLAHLLPRTNADASQSCAVNACERFSASADFFGHYKGNTAIRGFRLVANLVHPEGFKAASCACQTVLNPIAAFTKLLNSKSICCSNCRDSLTHVQRSSSFIPAATQCKLCARTFATMESISNGGQQKCSGCVRSFGITRGPKYADKAVAFDEKSSLDINDAVFCLSMLGAFFDLKVEIGDNLLYSVHQDVHDGYISKTLAYLVV